MKEMMLEVATIEMNGPSAIDQERLRGDAFFALRESLAKDGQYARIGARMPSQPKAPILIYGRNRVYAFKENYRQITEGASYRGKRVEIDPKIADFHRQFSLISANVYGEDELPEDDLTDIAMAVKENQLRKSRDWLGLSDLLSKLAPLYKERHPEIARGRFGGGRNGKGSRCRRTDNPESGITVKNFLQYASSLTGLAPQRISEVLSLQRLEQNDRKKLAEGEITYSKALEIIQAKLAAERVRSPSKPKASSKGKHQDESQNDPEKTPKSDFNDGTRTPEKGPQQAARSVSGEAEDIAGPDSLSENAPNMKSYPVESANPSDQKAANGISKLSGSEPVNVPVKTIDQGASKIVTRTVASPPDDRSTDFREVESCGIPVDQGEGSKVIDTELQRLSEQVDQTRYHLEMLCALVESYNGCLDKGTLVRINAIRHLTIRFFDLSKAKETDNDKD